MTIKSFAFIKTADAFEYDFILDASLSLDTFIPFFITDIFIGNKNISFIPKNIGDIMESKIPRNAPEAIPNRMPDI